MSEAPKQSFRLDPETGDVQVTPKPRLLERLPSTLSAEAALEAVHFKLAVATEVFGGMGDGGRAGTYRAVLDVVDYFSDLGVPRATLQPLIAVAAAIVDADRGRQSRIFRPDAGPGTPPTSVDRLSFEGLLAVVTECCVRHKKAEGSRPYVEPGCKLALDLLKGSRLAAPVTKKQLRELRERVQQAGKDSPDGMVFSQLVSSEMAKARPLDYARLLVQHEWVSVPPA